MKLFKHNLKNKLILNSLLPVLLLAIVFLVAGISSIKQASKTEILSTLNGLSLQLRDDFTNIYPGNYSISGNNYYSGNRNIAESTALLDRYKTNFNTEVTIFFSNIRALTTIRDSSGKRIQNTVQQDQNIIDTVFNGKTYTSGNVFINDEEYYVSYIPLYDNGIVYGMIFVGLSNKNFLKQTQTFKTKLIITVLIISLLISIISSIFARKIGLSLISIKNYLNELQHTQNEQLKIDSKVLERNDEIGDLGRYAQEIGIKINKMISLDPLTQLYNRRSGTQLIDYYFEKALIDLIPYTVVMCDIDFFKKINDTYGHKAGDEVLINISNILNNSQTSFAIRWGGEEFLLGFTKTKEEVIQILENVSAKIKSLSFTYNQLTFSVTMTFGISTYTFQPDSSTLVVQADKNLYKGKNSGRDTIVY